VTVTSLVGSSQSTGPDPPRAHARPASAARCAILLIGSLLVRFYVEMTRWGLQGAAWTAGTCDMGQGEAPHAKPRLHRTPRALPYVVEGRWGGMYKESAGGESRVDPCVARPWPLIG